MKKSIAILIVILVLAAIARAGDTINYASPTPPPNKRMVVAPNSRATTDQQFQAAKAQIERDAKKREQFNKEHHDSRDGGQK